MGSSGAGPLPRPGRLEGSGLPTFKSFDGIENHYEVLPASGAPALLLHGYASSSHRNWVRQGITKALNDAGYELILLDARGHGKSEKPYDPAAYRDGAMAKDASALLDLLSLEAVHVVGYSMGARNALRVAAIDPRVRSVVAGGVGAKSFHRMSIAQPKLSAAMLAEDSGETTDARSRAFRDFADLTRADKRALAAVAEGDTGTPDLSAIAVPVLFLIGEDDTIAGSPEELAEQIPNARVQTVHGDHLTALVDPQVIPAILDFLRETTRNVFPLS